MFKFKLKFNKNKLSFLKSTVITISSGNTPYLVFKKNLALGNITKDTAVIFILSNQESHKIMRLLLH